MVKVHANDVAFFTANPARQFRARRYRDGDVPSLEGIALFSDNGAGTLAEINVVVIKRTHGARLYLLFAATPIPKLKSDQSIVTFLIGRGVDPLTFKAVRRF